MSDLPKLRRLAEAENSGGWYHMKRLPCIDLAESDEVLFSAVSPADVLKLIAVARAARALAESCGDDGEDGENGGQYFQLGALMQCLDALAALSQPEDGNG